MREPRQSLPALPPKLCPGCGLRILDRWSWCLGCWAEAVERERGEETEDE